MHKSSIVIKLADTDSYLFCRAHDVGRAYSVSGLRMWIDSLALSAQLRHTLFLLLASQDDPLATCRRDPRLPRSI